MISVRVRFAVSVVVCALLCAFVVAPVPLALADFSNPKIDTIAQMRTDGSLHVTEQRSFDFEERYSILTWEFTGISDKQTVEVAAVRVSKLGDGGVAEDWQALSSVPFQSAWRDFVWNTEGITENIASELAKLRATNAAEDVSVPAESVYSLDARSNKLYLFVQPTDEPIIVECDYKIEHAALAYYDVAELYWDYVAAKQDIVTRAVNVQIQLPIPDGAIVIPGENVMAWGHGPSGTVDIKNDGTIDFAIDEVRSGQYAQAHVIFPVGWLSNLTVQQKLAKSGLRADDARAEEAAWVDGYTAGRINDFRLNIATAVICILVLLAAALVYRKRGREFVPDPDAPMQAYDAAVVGRTLRWNKRSVEDFVATLAQLASRGVITISEDGDTRFRVTPLAKKVTLSSVERDAMEFVFDDVGAGYQSVSMSEILIYCKRNTQEAQEKLKAWQVMLTGEVASAGLFDKASAKAAKRLAVLATILIVIGIATWPASWMRGAALVVTGAFVAIIAYHVPRRTQIGSDLALRATQEDCAQNAAEAEQPSSSWQDELSSILEEVAIADGSLKSSKPGVLKKWLQKTTSS